MKVSTLARHACHDEGCGGETPRPRGTVVMGAFGMAASNGGYAKAACWAGTLSLVFGLVGGCTGDAGPRQQLEARRTSSVAEADNLALLAELRTALNDVAPGLKWRTPEPAVESGSGCKEPFSGIDGTGTRILTSGDAFGGIPEADWDRAWEAVKAVAAKRGYGDELTLLDKPGEHQMSVYDKDGSELSVGTGVNTVATIYGACYFE